MAKVVVEVRGATDALQMLYDMAHPAETVAPEVVSEGKELLNNVAQGFEDQVLTPEQMRNLLQTMIQNTSFAEARVDYLDQDHPQVDAYQSMYVIMGDYLSGNAYNVWFSREGQSWVVKYNKIPLGGNLR